MTEREMEELIATFPSGFLPRRQLVLKARQQSFSNVGRFDLLFEDEFQRKILMELKSTPARIEDADQLVRYNDELSRLGERDVLMCLVAPQIPRTIRDTLDRFGIEYSEIHMAEFIRVAERRGVMLGETAASPDVDLQAAPCWSRAMANARTASEIGSVRARVETGPVVTMPGPLRWSRQGYDLVLRNREKLDTPTFVRLIEVFEQAVPCGRNARVVASLRRLAADARLPMPLSECQSLLRWVITSGWKSAVPATERVWAHLFGCPTPTWQLWSGSKYEFDAEGCERWYQSLPH